MRREDFWDYVAVGQPDECWPWLRSTCSDGYGTARIDGRTLGTHRVAYELRFGSVPTGLSVLHRCDNPPCCNPGHFFLGTQAQNNADRQRKGRTNRESRNAGSRNGNAVLTEDEVRQIRAAVGAGESRRRVAARFAVHRASVDLIVARKTWRHV